MLKIDVVLSENLSEPINVSLAPTEYFSWLVYDITLLSQSLFQCFGLFYQLMDHISVSIGMAVIARGMRFLEKVFFIQSNVYIRYKQVAQAFIYI